MFNEITRRRFCALSASAATGYFVSGLSGAAQNAGDTTELLPGVSSLGRVMPMPAQDITTLRSNIDPPSPFSVGFETLDREHFDPERTYDHLAKLGVKWARCQTGWRRCEVRLGEYDFSWLDDVVDRLLEIGIQPWFNLGYGNRLYTPEADETAVGWAPVFDSTAHEAWLRFTGALADHFKARVCHWEIWNEPNHSGFWKPGEADAPAYVRMVATTVPVIRKSIPNAVIIGGAFAGMPKDYLQQCLDAGLADHIDVLSYHPYRAIPERNYEAEVRAFRAILDAYKPGIALWQGENGCPSKGGEGSVGALSKLDWDEVRQAKWLLRRLMSDLALEIKLTSYFHTVDLVGYRGQTNYKGLLRGEDYSPKPAYRAYQSLCALFDGKTQRRHDLSFSALDKRVDSLQTPAFSSEGYALYPYWYPADLQGAPWQCKTIRIEAVVRDNARLNNPVLVDLLTGEYYPLEIKEKLTDSVVFDALPLLDYPLLVMGRE